MTYAKDKVTTKNLIKENYELKQVLERKTLFIEENGLTLEYLKWASKEKRDKKCAKHV